MVSVWFEGIDQLNSLSADLGKASARVGRLAAVAVRASASDIERNAKLFCPVDTGNLRNSISTDLRGDGRSLAMEAEIGPTANYGAYVEFGTSRMAPHAYMGPAFDRGAVLFQLAIEQLTAHILD
ncbi:HK97-gp10 family putative phage morphogenesis protein [Angustibacter sp. McL0619]|uniref:HK97-gp10 family putative phage morphogenesis protein n=1 Tax=Angustibacter sp. McL0619 TaxID=3415676 RepID=UPI003CF0C7E2